MTNSLKYFVIGLILLTSKPVLAQKELSLDSVFSITGSIATKSGPKYYTDTVSYSVPTGKIWKVEHFGFYNNGGGSPSLMLHVNGYRIFEFRTTSVSGVYESSHESAMWFGPGDRLDVIILASGVGPIGNYMFSILEFKLE